MEKHFTILISLIFLTFGWAKGQNYQTVNENRTASFVNAQGKVDFVRIDSTLVNEQQVLYPFAVSHYISPDCFSPSYASWLGAAVVIREDGYNIFLNHNLDTIRINTLAGLDDEWLVYYKPDHMQVWGKIIAHEPETFLGLTDSVKTIAFQVYDMEMNEVDEDVNGLQVQLSKNYGFVKTLNFYQFPVRQPGWYDPNLHELTLAGLSDPEVGIQNFSWFDVYDFQVGDVLHIIHESGDWQGEADGYFNTTETRSVFKYLERVNYPDSIVYTYSLNQRIYKDWLGSIELTSDTLTQVIEPNPAFDNLPAEPSFEYNTEGIPFIYRYYVMMEGEHTRKEIYNYWFGLDTEGCWRDQHYDGSPHHYYYLNGLGGPYHWYEAMFGSAIKKELVYYEKGDVVWGTPLDITSVSELTVPSRVTIYPNPASHQVTISIAQAGHDGLSFGLYDLNGQRVQSFQLHQGNHSLPLDNLNSGMYFLVISNKEGLREVQKLIIR